MPQDGDHRGRIWIGSCGKTLPETGRIHRETGYAKAETAPGSYLSNAFPKISILYMYMCGSKMENQAQEISKKIKKSC